MYEDDFVEFSDDFKKGSWYVGNRNINLFGEEDENGDSAIIATYSNEAGDRPYKECYEKIKGKDLKARLFLGYLDGKPRYKVFTDWEELAKVLGISELVTLATKVPKVVARRFMFFANEEGGRSSVLRSLVYDYVKKKMIEQIDTLMLKEDI